MNYSEPQAPNFFSALMSAFAMNVFCPPKNKRARRRRRNFFNLGARLSLLLLLLPVTAAGRSIGRRIPYDGIPLTVSALHYVFLRNMIFSFSRRSCRPPEPRGSSNWKKKRELPLRKSLRKSLRKIISLSRRSCRPPEARASSNWKKKKKPAFPVSELQTPPRGGVAGLPRRASGGGRSTTTSREAGYICVNLEVATACTSELNTIKNETQQQKRWGARCDEATFE